MKKQKFTSAGTSINSRNLPRAFRRFAPLGRVLDYGCGRFWHNTESYCLDRGATAYFPFDPYNCSEGVSRETLESIDDINTAYCCNVLNVIAEDDIIMDIIQFVCSRLAIGGCAIFQIYEGNKSGIGRETKKDCYQRNLKSEEYLPFFLCLPARFKYERHYNYIIVTLKN